MNDPHRAATLEALRARDPAFDTWARGYGVIQHLPLTQHRVASLLERAASPEQRDAWLALLHAADRIACMGMWLVAHMTYVRRPRLDGSPLSADDFKPVPEGHTGGALNMVPAYTGYLLANSLSGDTRAWLMGQGHCVAAIDALNLLTGNMMPEHARRYALDDAGLATFVNDFYHYGVGTDGAPRSPLGSHVNAHTAGGISEGGYLGFAELQYVHMPLPGQSLVAFLSDGAFEEQRGSDWSPRWWRAEDCGTVLPVMIANGRRIDQRTSMSQSGGTPWFRDHLTLNGFDPLTIDGRDPAAFAWALLDGEHRLAERVRMLRDGVSDYPVRLPYVIAETVKGFGFPGAGSNAAHNLPLADNPANDERARASFNAGAAKLFVPAEALREAIATLNNHGQSDRPAERDHPLANPAPHDAILPALIPPPAGTTQSPMAAIDDAFVALVRANPDLRVRIGNPDEMRSNRLNASLDMLQHRVTHPEPGIAESLHGSVITALNEEAVVCAALGNKQGLNLVASYEAFAVKMLGAMRQEIIFARHQASAGRPPRWLSLPILCSSHTWENGKNEQSHQDPTLCEAWLGEMNDVASVLFPVDGPSAARALLDLYASRGRIAVMVVPKNALPVQLDANQATQLSDDGVLCLHHDQTPAVQLFAIGAYQLEAMQRASQRLREKGIAHALYALQAPGRFRAARDAREATSVHDAAQIRALIPDCPARVFLCHGRPEVFSGVLRPLDTGTQSRFLGYRNRGGTLDTFGMLYANGATWAHATLAVAESLSLSPETLLDEAELAAVQYRSDNPDVLR
ncbi:xylulose 5-phosphate 3-epimerase [Alcanivorax sp. JB21]|uniref:xylulose 5-phosphate 3-epimerase n=1 Tax=Alcanivorax limicola TaxID=2874102 RepID=UPI001CBD33B8|nr:xylulose 5-phosphate 3-epimerase [Alcanivorax limicola]MBZ2189771.1 xylulose 5-phosphate 3-epimerase [Alcanivorax limicola]